MTLNEIFQDKDFRSEYPFESHFLELNGWRYHYVDEGQGEQVLLFVHGNPTWSFMWRNLLKAFRPHFRVLAVDHIGCGLSDKPPQAPYSLSFHISNLERLVRHLNLQHITLVAHDWGGAIGMGTAVRLPDRFERFVLMNTAAFRSNRIPWRIAVCRWPLLGPIAVRGFNAFARAALSQALAHPERLSPPVRRAYLAPYNNWKNRVAILRFVQDIPLSPKHPSYNTLLSIEQSLSQFQDHPILLIWGEQDWCFTTWFLEEFVKRFPRAEVCRIAEAGHYVVEDATEQVIERMLSFLKKTKCNTSAD